MVKHWLQNPNDLCFNNRHGCYNGRLPASCWNLIWLPIKSHLWKYFIMEFFRVFTQYVQNTQKGFSNWVFTFSILNLHLPCFGVIIAGLDLISSLMIEEGVAEDEVVIDGPPIDTRIDTRTQVWFIFVSMIVTVKIHFNLMLHFGSTMQFILSIKPAHLLDQLLRLVQFMNL